VVAIAVMSAVAMVPSGKGKAIGSDVVDKAQSNRFPGFPYACVGHTYDSDGSTILPACDVTIKNLRTADSHTVVSDSTGYYQDDLNDLEYYPLGWVTSDTIDVTAVQGTMMGHNQTTYDEAGFSVVIDVTLDTVIPEFSMVIVPVVGMAALVVGLSMGRRGKQ